MSTEPLSIHERMALVMRDVKGVSKDSRNPQGNYSYAGHEAITEALRAAYVKHGILRIVSVKSTEIVDKGTIVMTIIVSWIAAQNPSSRVEVESVGVQSSVSKSGGLSPVMAGMALSYAVKNAEMKCFALTGDATPDPEAQPDRSDEVSSGARELAASFLARFELCNTLTEIQELKAETRAAWPTIRAVPGLAEDIAIAIRKATARESRDRDARAAASLAAATKGGQK